MTTAPDGAAAARLSRRLAQVQHDKRIPAISAALRRDKSEYWAGQVHANPDTSFRIGSITKTFTAVLVMQCRDAGLLTLDEPLGPRLGLDLPAGVTVRRALSHGSGLQREPHGDVWNGATMPDREQLLAQVPLAEQVLVPGRRFHYSNLAFALLGEVVARARNMTWEQALENYLLTPLGLSAVTVAPGATPAPGSFVEPYSDVARAEPRTDAAGVGPAAQLWSTAAELARWGSFLADPDPAVLAATTVDEMCELTVMADGQRWALGLGLGLMLYRRDGGIFIGHGGAMPGFLAGLVVDRESKTAAAVLTATGVGADAETLAAQLIEDSLDADPLPIAPWTPGSAPPAEVLALLGRWWTEGNEVVISWHDRLEARAVGAPDWRPPAVFVRLDNDETGERWRTESGRETGELLRVARGGDGSVIAMSWATYALTRHPAAFADLLPPA